MNIHSIAKQQKFVGVPTYEFSTGVYRISLDINIKTRLNLILTNIS